jgi:hypothetical protein
MKSPWPRLVRLIAACLIGMAAPALSQSEAAKPQLVLIETDPWLMVVGSDSPEFALYDDGLVVFRRADGYFSVRLAPEEQASLFGRFTVAGLDEHYDAARATDQPTNIFIDFRGEKPAATLVYGSLRRPGTKDRLPEMLVSMYDAFHDFDHPRATAWLPDKIEVMVWPYEYAPEESIAWPTDWPGLDAEDTVARGEESFSIYLPSARFDELRAFLATRRQRGAVEIEGRKWAVSIRYPFPGEHRWIIQ